MLGTVRRLGFLVSVELLQEVGEIVGGELPRNDGQLPNGETLPLMRLRYCGSAARWGFAMYLYSTEGYEDAVLPTGAFAGLPEDALDCAAGLYLSDLTP
jgi:hypothetical protein